MNAQTQPLVIEAPAMLAERFAGHNVRSQPEQGEEGGDAGEFVSGRDLRFTGIVLTEEQAKQLVGEYVWPALFNSGAPDKPRTRLFTSFTKIPLDDVYKNCSAEVTFGVSKSVVTIAPATIKNIRVKYAKTGSDLEMSCTVVGVRPRCVEVLDLEDFGGKPVELVLAFGPLETTAAGQHEMPLDQPPVDRTRMLAPGQAEREAEVSEELRDRLREADGDRQLEEAARFHEGKQDAAA